MARVATDDDELLPVHGSHVESVVVDREHDERRLEPSLPHGVRHERRVLPDQPQAHVRVAAAELGGEAGDEVGGGGAEHAEAERPAAELANVADGVARAVDVVEHALGLRAEGPTGLRERDAATGTREQLDAELGLELADLLGERGLRDEQRPRGRGEGAVLDGGEEVAELLESHR